MGVASAPSLTMPGRPSSLDIKSNEGWVDSQSPVPSARINVLDLKDQIVKKVGLDSANKYFAHVQRFISSRMLKQELDKLVVLTIGKENVALHNQLVKAILSNAVNAQAPPPLPLPAKSISKLSKVVQSKPATSSNSSGNVLPLVSSARLLNGDCIPSKTRVSSNEHDQKGNSSRKEYPVPDSCQPDYGSEGIDIELDAEAKHPPVPPLKRLRAMHPAATDNGFPINSQKLSIAEKGTLGQMESYAKIPLDMSPSFWCARHPPCLAFPMHVLTEQSTKEGNVNAELPDLESTHKRMEEIALQEGLEGVDQISADLLNCAVDLFLSKLIKSCVDVAKSSQHRLTSRILVLDKKFADVSVSADHNGALPSISLRDFKVAMDLNPDQLGKDWPLQLEKISVCLFDHEASCSN